ncbi:MAG: S8/S53 family peptidase [Saprospiraceae bacterium]
MAATNFEFVPQAWRDTKGANVSIALFDTGVSLEHPCFQHLHTDGCKFNPALAGFDSDQADGNDDVSDALLKGSHHGTQNAGVMVAQSEDADGPIGIAPEANLLIFKMRDKDYNSFVDYFLNALKVCIRKEVDVIVCPYTPVFQNPVARDILDDIFNQLEEKKILMVCCAANSGRLDRFNNLQFPADRPQCINTGVVQSMLLNRWQDGDTISSNIPLVWNQASGIFCDNPSEQLSLLRAPGETARLLQHLAQSSHLQISAWKSAEGSNYKRRSRNEVSMC